MAGLPMPRRLPGAHNGRASTAVSGVVEAGVVEAGVVESGVAEVGVVEAGTGSGRTTTTTVHAAFSSTYSTV